MEQQPLYLLDRESPAERRRRQQRQQQSTCCSCLLVVISALIMLIVLWHPLISWWQRRSGTGQGHQIVTMFPLQVQTDAAAYRRYSLVRLQIQVTNPYGETVRLNEPPQLVVRRDEQIIITVAGVRRLTPSWDANSSSYICYWPIPWAAQPGEYVAEAKIKIPDPDNWPWQLDLPPDAKRPSYKHGTSFCIARVPFQISRQLPPSISPGLCAATWEADFPEGQVVKRPDGTAGDWRAILDWCEFLGADALWFRGAVTRRGCTDEAPFVKDNIEAIPRLAAAAHRRGLRFGTWAVAYATYPRKRTDNRGLPSYQWAQDISRSTGQTSNVSFISLLDPKRITHLADFFEQMQKTRDVDFVGLDYIRNDRGGYEMTDQFTSQMPVDLPENWADYSRKQRWKYVAQKVESEWNSDVDFYEQWNWWRAHLNASNVEQIIRESGIRKPVWIFQLGWMHGAQHGQDAFMFNDAGVAFVAPMLYQSESFQHFDYLIKSWKEYTKPGQVNLIAGDQVDDYWHKQSFSATKGSRRPAAPEVMYLRMMQAHREMVEGERTIGAFWHDISRAAVQGRLGPYPGSEWALAGAAAFSDIRQSWEVYPLRVQLSVPDSAPIGAICTAQITVKNVSQSPTRDIIIKLEKTEHIVPVSHRQRQVAEIGPGEVHIVPLRLRITQADTERANRYMVAVRVGWAPGDYGEEVRRDLPRTIVAMKYINGI